MIPNSEIQSALVSKIKANATIVLQLTNNDTEDIKEDNWQGRNFDYPAIRINLLDQVIDPSSNDRCLVSKSIFSIIILSTDDSSKQADDIAGVVASQLDNKGFTQSGIKFERLRCERLIPAKPVNDLWRSEAVFSSRVRRI